MKNAGAKEKSDLKVSDVLKSKGGRHQNSVLIVELPGMMFTTEIKYATMSSKDVKAAHKPTFRDSEGREVVRKYIGGERHLEWRVKENLDEQAAGDITAYQTINGEEKAVIPFEVSKALKIKKLASPSAIHEFFVEKRLEMWGEDQSSLCQFADYLLRKEQIALCSLVMTKGYDTQYLALIQPRVIEGKVGFVVHLAKKKMEFNHLLDPGATKVEEAAPIGLELVGEVLG